MAIIKTIRYPINTSSMTEDPTPGSNNLFFQSDLYAKDTLAPQYDQGLIFTTDGSLNTSKYWGVSNPTNDIAFGLGGILMLNNEVTHVRHVNLWSVSGNEYRSTLDWAPFASMDPNYKVQPIKYFTDGVNTLIQACWNYMRTNEAIATYYYTYNTRHWSALNMNSAQLVQNGYLTLCTQPTNTAGALIGGYHFGWLARPADAGTSSFPLYRNPSTGNLVWIAQATGNSGQYPYAVGGASITPMFSASPTQQAPSGSNISDSTNQFLGVSALDGFSINFRNSVLNDHTQSFVKYNDGNNTISTLGSFSQIPYRAGAGSTGSYAINSTGSVFWSFPFTFTGTNVTPPVVGVSTFTGTATYVVVGTSTYVNITLLSGPGATSLAAGSIIFATTATYTLSTGTTLTGFGLGTNIGGDRTTTFGNYIAKYASETFTDPSTSTTKGFYVPYVDVVGNYNPHYFQWNNLNDTFIQYANVNVLYPTTGTNISTYWSADTLSAGSNNTQYGLQRLWTNETFVSGGNRYLIFMQLHGAGGIFDSYPLMRTFPTYSVNAQDPRRLTYVTNLQVPASPKNIVWLSDNKTILGIVTHNAFFVYAFTAASGWTLSGNFPYQFNAVGRDGLGRIWGQDTGIGYGRLHLITLNVPVNIVVTSDAASYYYSGGSATANLTVNAYSYNGSRIATPVKLVIDGGSMTFAGNNLTLSITTSASADTIVPVTITGGGVANIIASASLSS